MMNSVSVPQTSREKTWLAPRLFATLSGAVDWAWRVHRSLIILGAELVLAAGSYTVAVYALSEARSDFWPGQVFSATLGLLLVLRLAGLWSVRLYSRSMRSASVPDFISIVNVVSTTTVVFAALVLHFLPRLKVPIAIFLLDWALLLLLWGALHFGARVLRAKRAEWRKTGKRVIVIGAGDAGITLLKDLAQDQSGSCRVLALVDDNPEKWGRSICGVFVAGGLPDLARISTEGKAEEILICIPSATPSQMENILGVCRQIGIPVKTLPSLTELVDGTVSMRDLRVPRIEDLLRRERIRLDVNETRSVVGGKVVLVTGAGGSIGSELCRQIADAGPAKLLLLDKSENSLFYVHREVCERMESGRVKPLLVDLVCRTRVHEILMHERPEVIFHAAAHKHVGLLELHPQEAIRNNVLGTRNIAEAAVACGATRFVNISTDKAVSPTSYLGLSKKLTELCIQETARLEHKRFSNVRFGNVAGSTGSVLRLFWEQIQKGDPLRVTDPRATRYFMSVPEAVHLILRAATLAHGGETFVFEMGEPVNIYELAKTMMLFAGLRPERDLAIEFTGLTDGEKVTEELWESWERPVPTEDARILKIADQDPQAQGILAKIDWMENLLAQGNPSSLLTYLADFAPEFHGNRKPKAPVHAGPIPFSAIASEEAA
jgi:FlaA1/EpsC-like NDP-sugar epimerase